MGREQRKCARRKIGCRATVAVNERAPRLDCVIVDISQSGARLVVDTAIELPGEFLLMLSRNVSRRCTLVWRSERKVGVRFRGAESG